VNNKKFNSNEKLIFVDDVVVNITKNKLNVSFFHESYFLMNEFPTERKKAIILLFVYVLKV
jgi:hypothetical protein